MGSRKEQIGRHCPYCGAMVSYDEYFCRACHKRFTDLNELDAPSIDQPEEFVVSLPKLWVSTLLSCIGVGAGQFYNGDTIKGITFFLAFLLVSFDYIVTPYNRMLYIGVWALATAEALWSAHRIGRCEIPYSGISYPLYAELALLGFVALLHVTTGQPDLAYMAKLFPSIGVWVG